jgi:hypothetical protein
LDRAEEEAGGRMLVLPRAVASTLALPDMYVYARLSGRRVAVPRGAVSDAELRTVLQDLFEWYYKRGRQAQLRKWKDASMSERIAQAEAESRARLMAIEARLQELEAAEPGRRQM